MKNHRPGKEMRNRRISDTFEGLFGEILFGGNKLEGLGVEHFD